MRKKGELQRGERIHQNAVAQRSGFATPGTRTGFQGIRSCTTVLHYWIDWRRVSARPRDTLETGVRQVLNLSATQFFEVRPAKPPPSRFDAGELAGPEQSPDRGFRKPGESNGLFDIEKQLVP